MQVLIRRKKDKCSVNVISHLNETKRENVFNENKIIV
jgi:hypothetical protein